jgi:hypothetical protein
MRRIRTMLGSCLALALLGGGPALGSTSAPDFDGESLFTGLFLAHGPVAEAHPELPLPQPGRPWEAREAEQLTVGMERLAPGFLTTFKADITSGDRLLIDRALESAQSLAARAARPPGQVNNPNATFIFNDKAIFKATHVVVNKNRYWNGEPDGRPSLSHERWVDDVAETLAR